MSERPTVRTTLAELADLPIEPVEPRLAELEARLLAAITDDGDGRFVAVAAAPLRSTNRPQLVLGVAAAVCGLLIATVLLFPRASDDSIVIAAADDVTVELPNGAEVAGAAGLELPDGSILDVLGFVDINGRRLGPGRYRVDRDDLIALPDTITSTTQTTIPGAASRVTAVPVSTTAPSPTRAPASTNAPATARATDPPPVTRPGSTTSAPPATRPATQPTSTVQAPTRSATVPAPQRATTSVATTTATTTTTSVIRPATTIVRPPTSTATRRPATTVRRRALFARSVVDAPSAGQTR